MQIGKVVSKKQINIAAKYLEISENLKAISYLSKSLDKNPSNAEAWLLLGIAKRRTEKLEEAIKCFKKATELDTSMLEAWGLLTMTFIDQGDINQAASTIENAAEINPYNEKIQFFRENLIRVYTKFGPFF